MGPEAGERTKPPLLRAIRRASAVSAIACLATSLFLPGRATIAVAGPALAHRAPIGGAVPLAVRSRAATPTAAVAGSTPILVTFGLPLRNERLLDRFIAREVPLGHYLTQQAFDHLYAPS